MVCPPGGPPKSTIPHGSLLKVLMGPSPCSQCHGKQQVFLKGLVPLSFWQTEGPPLLFSFMLRGGALWVHGRDPLLRMTLPLAHRRSQTFLACISLGACPIYQGIYSASSCHYDCGGIGIGYSLLSGSTSQNPVPVGGQLLKPTCGFPWPPGGPHHVGFSSDETGTDLLIG